VHHSCRLGDVLTNNLHLPYTGCAVILDVA